MEHLLNSAGRKRESLRDAAIAGISFYSSTTTIVVAGAFFGCLGMHVCREHPHASRSGIADAFLAWDGKWYQRIGEAGYVYDPKRESSVAFFPLYPFAAALVARASSLRVPEVLLLVSHLSYVIALGMLARYVVIRFPLGAIELQHYVLVAAGILPTTFYFRMAYSESLFFLLCVAVMHGLNQRWHAGSIAVLIGAATATRPTGVGLIAPFALHLWELAPRGARIDTSDNMRPRHHRRLQAIAFGARAVLLILLACWGIAAYMAFQWSTFGEPLAFVKTQAHWGRPMTHISAAEYVWRLLTLAPIREVYDPASACYWGLRPPRDNPFFNMMFANPIYFLLAVGCTALGAWKRWLNAKEVALSAGLLLIPYVTQADRMCMASQARFASVVAPMYLVLGQILVRLPGPVVAIVAALSATMLALYTALFVNWYWFY